jgi:hypothetical protein
MTDNVIEFLTLFSISRASLFSYGKGCVEPGVSILHEILIRLFDVSLLVDHGNHQNVRPLKSYFEATPAYTISYYSWFINVGASFAWAGFCEQKWRFLSPRLISRTIESKWRLDMPMYDR